MLAVALLAAACGGDSERDGTVVASIADRELTRAELDDLLPDGDNTVPERVATIVESWLTTQAVEFEIADRGYPVTDEDRELAAEVVEANGGNRNDTETAQLEDAIAVSYAVGRWTEVEIEAAGDPELPGYLCSNHLLVETEFVVSETLADIRIQIDSWGAHRRASGQTLSGYHSLLCHKPGKNAKREQVKTCSLAGI